MKNLKAAIIALLFVAKAFSQSAGGAFEIHGHISQIQARVIFFSHTFNNKTVIDSSNILNGDFTFSGKIAYPSTGYFRLDKSVVIDANSLLIFLEPTTINVELKGKQFSTIKIEGSKTHDEYLIWKNQYTALRSKFAKVLLQSENEKDAGKHEMFQDSIALYYSQRDSMTYDFFTRYNNSYVTPYLLSTTYRNYNCLQLKKVYDSFNDGLKASNYGQLLFRNIEKMKANTTGDIAANIASSDYVNGKSFDMRAQRGKYIAIDFWGSWCQPCLKLMPSVVEEHSKYKDKNIVFISVCRDYNANKDKCKEIVNKLGMNWINLWDSQDKTDENSTSAIYNVGVYPTFIVIGPNGDILERGEGDYGYLKYKKQLEKVFGL